MSNLTQPIYSGRAIICGQSGGSPFVGYRLSSHSFGNRQLRLTQPGRVQVAPNQSTDPFDAAQARFIFYDCLIAGEQNVVSANGLHGDNIAVKLKRGSSVLDALAFGLLSWDFEDDGNGTPRIAAVLDLTDPTYIYLGIIKPAGLHVDRLPLHEGHAYILATNTFNLKDTFSFNWQVKPGAAPTAEALLTGDFITQLQLSHPVAAAAWQNGNIASVGAQ